MTDLHAAIEEHKDLPEDKQKQAGQAIEGPMSQQSQDFLQTVLALIKDGKIDPLNTQTFMKVKVYESLDPEWKAKTDLAIVNISSQLQRIKEFYESDKTPNSSPHLEQMIAELWQMKERIEVKADVFVF